MRLCPLALVLAAALPALAPAAKPTLDTPSPAVTSRTWLIAIGAQNYAHVGKLSTSGADVAALAGALIKNGLPPERAFLFSDGTTTRAAVRESGPGANARRFNAVRGCDRATLLEALPTLLSPYTKNGPQENDTLIFFFSGHAAEATGKAGGLYLLPPGAVRGDFKNTAIPFSALSEWIDGCKATHKIILLDTCHSGSADLSSVGIKAKGASLVDQFGHVKGSYTIASCDSGEKSYLHKDKKLSAFSYFLRQGLQGYADANRDNEVSVDELYAYLHRSLTDRNSTYGKQTPVRRFVGTLATVTVLGGRRPGGIWSSIISLDEGADGRDLGRTVLLIECREREKVKGRIYHAFVGGTYITDHEISGTWVGNTIQLKSPARAYTFKHGPESDTMTFPDRNGPTTLKRDHGRPAGVCLKATAAGGVWAAHQKTIFPQDQLSARVTHCERRKSSGELHVYDFRIQGYQKSLGGNFEASGCVVGSTVLLWPEKRIAGSTFCGLLKDGRLIGRMCMGGHRYFFLQLSGPVAGGP